MHRYITQSHLRDSITEVMDTLDDRRILISTDNGVPIGEPRPIPKRRYVPISEVLRSFADCPPIDYQSMRAESDALSGW